MRRVAVNPAPVAAGALNFTARVVVWDWETGRTVQLNLEQPYPEPAPTQPAAHLVFSSDGAHLLVAHVGEGLSLWDWAARLTLWAEHEEEAVWPVITEDGLLLTVSSQGLRLRDLRTGRVPGSAPGSRHGGQRLYFG